MVYILFFGCIWIGVSYYCDLDFGLGGCIGYEIIWCILIDWGVLGI